MTNKQKQLLKKYEDAFESVVSDLVEDHEEIKTSNAYQHLQNVVRHNVCHDNEARSFSVVTAYLQAKNGDATEEEMQLAFKLGWVWELMHAYLDMQDDFLDKDCYRHGKQTWYQLCEDKCGGLTDAFFLKLGAFRLLEKYFADHPMYADLLTYCNRAMYEYCLGQILEWTSKLELSYEKVDISDHYLTIANLIVKTGFITQIKLALALAGFSKCHDVFKALEKTGEKVTMAWAIRDDIRDSFAEDSPNPLTDIDIRSGKRKYLFMKAMELCNAEEREMLKQQYGRNDERSVELVKGLYIKLNVPNICKNDLKDVEESLQNDIKLMKENGLGVAKTLERMVEWYAKRDD